MEPGLKFVTPPNPAVFDPTPLLNVLKFKNLPGVLNNV